MAERLPHAAPFGLERWTWDEAQPRATEHLGRRCVSVENSLGLLDGVELADGAIEVELAVGDERGFHGVVWRARDEEQFESFFVRPHQVGNPDAVQYTPVFNGISAWQLYHGPGFWAPVSFPLDEWFRLRAVFVGRRAEVFIGDLAKPALEIAELKRGEVAGRVGVLAGGPAIHVTDFAYDGGDGVALRNPPSPTPLPLEGIVPAWFVSDAFEEGSLATAVFPAELDERTWTRLESEPSGLVDLARVNGVRGRHNTVFARAAIRCERAVTKALELGFSDRATLYLNGRALFRGDDTYRSRDYRFLGSIGYWDTVFLGLDAGDNDLVVAVSEDFGGWGVQARFPDPSGLHLARPA